ncbi:hypothetical protein, partial [Klebsiella pneumoniae]|uniref:hypothetical protein n=1 Tax=Klebsiella pneumoniae TaxID=573 RepID=UPI001953D70C
MNFFPILPTGMSNGNFVSQRVPRRGPGMLRAGLVRAGRDIGPQWRKPQRNARFFVYAGLQGKERATLFPY